MESKKGSLIVVFIVLMSAFCATLTTIPETVRATTLFVGGGGPGNYTTIQNAINASNAGDTVYVYSGTYSEQITVNKPLNLTGEDRTSTVIDGGGNGDTVNITSDWVNITGFTLVNSGSGRFDAAIELYLSENCSIRTNAFSNNDVGILLVYSDRNFVSNNDKVDNWAGVYLYFSNRNTITSNNIENSYGILVLYSDNNTITNNALSINTEGIFTQWSYNNTINSNTLSQSSISLFYSGNSVIGKNNISDSRPDAIRLICSDNNTVIDNAPSGLSGRITIDGSEKNRIIGNSISTDYGPGIYIEGSGANVVSDNNVSTNLVSIFVSGSANVTFLRNILEEGGFYIEGSTLHQWNTHSIDTSNKVNGSPIYYWKNRTGGTVPSGAGQAIIANCSGVSVENQSFVNGSVGIELGFSSYGTLWNNTFLSKSMEGIYSYASWNNSYSDNIFLSNNKSIYLQHSHNNSIFNNVMFDGLRGIELEWSNDNSIFDNNASSNIWSGLFLCRSDNNTIADNFASLNEWGVDLLQSDNNTIVGNVASLNGKYGIILKQSHSNRVYHNEISYNRFQAYDDMDTNQWDNGYPSGGNYWSDYTGDDQLSGPLQNLIGSDGIGDTSHMVDLDTWDRYPLMSPSGPIFPRPPVMLSAKLTGGNMENVTLAWRESPDDGSGLKSVVRYEIYRNSTYDPRGLGYGLVATVFNGTVRFVDTSVGEADPSDHFYLLCAVDLNNNTSCSTGQAGKYTRPLSKGPNLVSIPLIQSDETIQTVLQTVSYDNAWSFDPINQEWKSLSKSKPYGGTLEYVNHTMGIWVNVTQDSNLTVAGVVPTSTTINLQAGWNPVGFPSFDENFTVADLKAAFAVERIEGSDASAPPYFLRVMADGDLLQAGFGYWIRVGSETSWTTDNS